MVNMKLIPYTNSAPETKTVLFLKQPNNIAISMSPAVFNTRSAYSRLYSSAMSSKFRIVLFPLLRPLYAFFTVQLPISLRSCSMLFRVFLVLLGTSYFKLFRVQSNGPIHIHSYFLFEFLRIVVLPLNRLANQLLSILQIIHTFILDSAFNAMRRTNSPSRQMTVFAWLSGEV